MLGQAGGLDRDRGQEFGDGVLADAEQFQDADPHRVCEGLEELRLQLVERPIAVCSIRLAGTPPAVVHVRPYPSAPGRPGLAAEVAATACAPRSLPGRVRCGQR